MQNINFIQSTKISGQFPNIGILELFLAEIHFRDIFEPMLVIVPSLTMANWLNDQITLKFGIASNIKFILLSEFIQNLYMKNNPQAKLFAFQETKFILFDYLCSINFSDNIFDEIKSYLFVNSNLDYYRAFQLAAQLEQIFNEYIYLRTDEILNLSIFKLMPKWQKSLWDHFIQKISLSKSYLDIYKFFLKERNLSNISKQIYVFGLTSIYPSQLNILKQLAKFAQINWYYITISNEYYGDLLSDTTKAKLQQKVLREPNLSISDLYLISGNPLVANLANFSREFIELLLANEIYNDEIIENPPLIPENKLDLLQLIQNDIYQIKYRIDSKYWFDLNNQYYTEPLAINNVSGLKFNICYNKMREVQVLFNELLKLISENPNLKLNDILVTAPNIDDYSSYLNAVFLNEYAVNKDGDSIKLPIIITGNKPKRNTEVIDAIKFILNIPFEIPVSYFIEILSQSAIIKGMELTAENIYMVKTWLWHNQVRFGYDKTDYSRFEYKDFDINCFGRFIKNLILGVCLPKEINELNHDLPIYTFNNQVYVPYDNLENSHISLINKVIIIIELICKIRTLVYKSALEYNLFSLEELKSIFEEFKASLFTDHKMQLELDKFIGTLNGINIANRINLMILNALIDDYLSNFNTKVLFTSKITCASMQAVHHIPYKVIYILGMNWNEFPRLYSYNKLSILSNNWSLADRNLNLEDKQLFLDTILSAKDFLFISYIGRSEKDNSEIKPSPLVGLLQNTIKESIANGDILDQITQLHPLHPFYNNQTNNYSAFWGRAVNLITENVPNLRWNFAVDIPITQVVSDQQIIELKLKHLINTFLYTNVNLYKTLKLDLYLDPLEFYDHEGIEVISRELLKKLYKEFIKLDEINQLDLLFKQGKLATYLHTAGIIGYDHIGDYQLNYSLNLYKAYSQIMGNRKVFFTVDIPNLHLTIRDELLVDQDQLVVANAFHNLHINNEEYKINLDLRVKALIYFLLINVSQFKDINGQIVKITGVTLRIMSHDMMVKNYQVNLNHTIDILDLWARVLRFYLYSLTHPILIHKAALEEYLVAKESERLIKMRKIYENTFENKGLTDLLEDPVFSDIAKDYFNLSENRNLLVKIGQLLKDIQFNEVVTT